MLVSYLRSIRTSSNATKCRSSGYGHPDVWYPLNLHCHGSFIRRRKSNTGPDVGAYRDINICLVIRGVGGIEWMKRETVEDTGTVGMCYKRYAQRDRGGGTKD